MKKISLVFLLVILGAVLLTGCETTLSGDKVKKYAGVYKLTEVLEFRRSYENDELVKKLEPISSIALALRTDAIVIEKDGNITVYTAYTDSFLPKVKYLEGALTVNTKRIKGQAGNSVLIFSVKVGSILGFSVDFSFEYDPAKKTITKWELSDDEDDSVNGATGKEVYTLAS